MKRVAILTCLLGMGVAAWVLALAAGDPPTQAPDVLIIHAAGTPFVDADKFTPANVDAVSCPTPIAFNCQTVAEQVAEVLRAKKLAVRVVETADIKNRRQLLEPRALVLASPAYFGGPSWKMHKLLQEQFWQFFALGGKRMDGRLVATATTGHAEAPAKAAAAYVQNALKSCNAAAGPTFSVTTAQKPEEVKERVARFADELAARLNEGK